MDDNTERLVNLIVEDAIETHTNAAKARFHDYNLELERRHKEDRASAKQANPNAPESRYESYGSRRWTHEAEILKTCAEKLIRDLGDKIRNKTTDVEAGDMYLEGAKTFLSVLGEMYRHRFDMARPFYWQGRTLTLPIYWDRERPGLNRKIEIERLQFEAAQAPPVDGMRGPDRAEQHAPPTNTAIRKTPTRIELEAWANSVGNIAREQITADYLATTWTHENPDVRPTILEARTALDCVHGKRRRGNPGKSNRN